MNITTSVTSREYFFTIGSIVLTVFVLYEAKPVLVPLALALLLAFILSPIVALGLRLGLGRVASTLLTLALGAVVATTLTFVVVAQVAKLAVELPNHRAEIEAKLTSIRDASAGGPFARVASMLQEIAEQSEKDAGPDAAPPLRVTVAETSSLARSAEPVLAVVEPLATAGLVVVLMVFILLGWKDLRSRFLATLGQGQMIGTVRVLEDSAQRVGRYLLFQLMVNAMLGTLFGIGLYVLGVPYAPLWGVLTALLRFIPFVGTWVAATLPLALSFATSPGWQQPALVLGYFAVIDLLTANVVEPLLFGHHTGVSPIALLLGAAFWTWLWGPVGLLLSVPLTVCLTALGHHMPAVRPLALLLGDKPALPPHIEFYQRVLADGAPASEVVAVSAAASDAVASFDKVLIPALVMAHHDRASDALTAAEEAAVREAARAAIALVLRGHPHASVPSRLVAVGTPAHHEAEEVPLHMLAGAIERTGGRMDVLTTRLLPSDVIRHVAASKATAVVISNMPPGGQPQSLYLCRILREQFPQLLIIVARWGDRGKYDERLVSMRKEGASYLTTTVAQTLAQLHAATDPALREETATEGPDD